MTWTNTHDCVSDNVSVLIYGSSGSGKTTLAATLPNPESVLILNAENGLRSIKDSNIAVFDLTKEGDKALDRVHRFHKMMNFFEELENNEKYREKFKWLFIDSLTEIAQNLAEAMKQKHPSDGFKQWGEYNTQITDLVKRIRDMAHFNVIFTALDTVDTDDNGVRFTGIDLQGKISRRIPALLDEVFYLKKIFDDEGNEKRVLLTSEYKNIMAKDRSTNLDQFEIANLAEVIAKINK